MLVLLLIATLSLAAPAAGDVLPYELATGANETGRLRVLIHRLARQNVFYQLRVGEQRREDLVATAAQIDRVLGDLRRGRPAYSVPPPPSEAIREQLDRIEERWATLRSMALAGPYEYLRMSRQFAPPRDPFGDLLLIRHFDHISREVVDELTRLVDLYVEACEQVGYEHCELTRQSGLLVMWLERISKEIVLVYAEIDVEKNLDRLRESSQAFDAFMTALPDTPYVRGATADSRGREGEFVKRLLSGAQADWATLRGAVDRVLAGRAEEIILSRMLRVSARLTEALERMRAALDEYGAGAYQQ